MRVALYARYSSDNQRDASIEDQFRICRAHAEKNGWQIVACYSDRAISGTTLLRPGIQDLMAQARAGQFDIVLAEGLDRLSRDQEDVAGFYKRMKFADVQIETLSEGRITALHIGLTGTMNAEFIDKLSKNTHRGLYGRIKDGKSGGGLCYGYDVLKLRDAEGERICGERAINNEQAQIVRRIFQQYADGKSPKAIALTLNAEGLRGPLSGAWGPSTLNGNRERGTGILNNELYIGRLVWNRLRYLKDPVTKKRVSRLNPESKWVIENVPELRIIEQDLWEAVKARQSKTTWSQKSRGTGTHPLNALQRPTYLLTGLSKCGCCGGGFSMISKNHLGCSTARNKGTCENRLTIRRDILEKSVLNGLRTQMMDPALFKEFCDEFTREVNRLRMEKGADLATLKSELPKIERELDKAVQAILDGFASSALKTRMEQLEARKAEIEARLAEAPCPPPLLHPNMAELYRQKIGVLHGSLQNEATGTQAKEAIRSLITRIRLIPENGALGIFLEGDLAAMLVFATNKKNATHHPDAGVLSRFMVQGSLVAGACDRRRHKTRFPLVCVGMGKIKDTHQLAA
ncbi:DNA resolvase [Acetobacter tropicalis NRIC 0312]|uniref:Resolvase n=1 Tax=Acetobacter tropicalis TaxID=104102 RepID=A0A511FS92_9PROT|nr:recombinase family protein [Acetobacter tropicalis]KXV51195.1 resolvase [Acetobacter tropicalis]GAL97029.1 recombinase [Acetobacter tropicalis]GBR72164.1 DNA resolvase [Acetobacter tropicalis NRIC 0312]GEL51807.1 resolvase [Acetobacter tropicalis]